MSLRGSVIAKNCHCAERSIATRRYWMAFQWTARPAVDRARRRELDFNQRGNPSPGKCTAWFLRLVKKIQKKWKKQPRNTYICTRGCWSWILKVRKLIRYQQIMILRTFNKIFIYFLHYLNALGRKGFRIYALHALISGYSHKCGECTNSVLSLMDKKARHICDFFTIIFLL